MRSLTGIIWLATVLCALTVSIGQATQWPVDGDKKIFTTYGEYQHYEEDPYYYLHSGLDIAAPAATYVKSIDRGRVQYVRWENKMLVGGECEYDPDTTPWVNARYRWVILEDVVAGELTEVGWAYGHIGTERMQKMAEEAGVEDVLDWVVEPGVAFTQIVNFDQDPGMQFKDHVHVERMEREDCWSDWSPVIANPLRILHEAGVVSENEDQAPDMIPDDVKMDPDEGCAYQGPYPTTQGLSLPNWPYEDVSIVFGRADIVAHVDDYFDMVHPPGYHDDIYRLGVYSIGYSIYNAWQDGAAVEEHTRVFDGKIPDMLDDDLTKTIYRVTDRFASENDDFYYAVSNAHSELGDESWTAEAAKACWNTRMVDGGLPCWIAMDATQTIDPDEPGYPKFLDGVYRVAVHAGHLTVHDGNLINDPVSESIPVVVDNFAPCLKEIRVWKEEEEGTPGYDPESMDWLVYYARWKYDAQSAACSLQVLHREAVDDAALDVELTFSEDMYEYAFPVVYLSTAGNPDATQHFDGEWTSGRIWHGQAMEDPSGSGLAPDEVPFGSYVFEVWARDWPGNALDVTPAVVASRNTDDSWNDPEYDPAGTAPDMSHSIAIAPVLWALVNVNGQSSVVGYDADGDPMREVTANVCGISPVSLAGDPKDGGCWVLGHGDNGFVKISAAGQVATTQPVGAGTPLWIESTHNDGGPWTVRDNGSSLKVAKHGIDGVELDSKNIAANWFRSASVDQATGDIWIVAFVGSDVKLFRLRADTTLSPQDTLVINVNVAGSPTTVRPDITWETLDWIGVSAIPTAGCAWIAGSWIQCPTAVTVLELRQWDENGPVGSALLPRPVGGRDGTGTCESGYNTFTGVETDPRTGEGAWVWMTSTEHDDFIPASGRGGTNSVKDGRGFGDYHFEADDRLGIAGGPDPNGHHIVLDGCTTACGDEYVGDRLLSASPRLGGVWWVRPHRVPGGGRYCDDPSYPGYTATFHMVPSNGMEEVRFEREFPGAQCPDPAGEGIIQISACAGATWEFPQSSRPPTLAAEESVPDVEMTPPNSFAYRLGSVYPNPCIRCPGITVRYSLGGAAAPRFELYNLAGQLVRVLIDGMKTAGEYRTEWNLLDSGGKRVPPATYLLRMSAEEFEARKPIIVIE